MSRFISPTLYAVTPDTPGGQPQDQQYIKLNTNESPYLPSPAVVAAVSEAEVEKLRLYSDPACADLLRSAAAHFGLQPDQIMPGNGSDENLFFALRAFCDEQHPLAYADITYGCYSVWCGPMWTLAARAACPSSTGTRTCWWCRPFPSPASWPVPGWVWPWAMQSSLPT